MYTFPMKYLWLGILTLLLCITIGGIGVFVARLPATHAVLSHFEPPVYPPVESTSSNPYIIPAGAYALTSGNITFTLAHPHDTVPSYTGATLASSGGITLTTIESGDIAGTGIINLDLAPLTFTIPLGGNDTVRAMLTGPHFFDTSHYPDATFSILSIKKIPTSTNRFTVATRFTFLGEMHDLVFPATLFVRDGVLALESDFAFDRTQWGMTYASASFVGDNAVNAVSDMVAIHMALTLQQ